MKLDRWLTVKRSGSTRITARKPDTEHDEIAVHLLMEIPDALFWRPTIEAHVVVPREATPPLRLDAEVLQQVDDAIRSTTGLQVILSVAESEELGEKAISDYERWPVGRDDRGG